MHRTRIATVAVGSALSLVLLAACSGPTESSASAVDDGTDLQGGSTTYPLTIDNCGYKQTFDKAPSRVVLMNGASVAEVEALILLGAEDSILVNTQNYGVSDEPGLVEEIDALPKADIDMAKSFEIPSEQMLALKPDLVIATTSGGFDTQAGQASREELADAGIKTLVNPANCAMGKEKPTKEEKDAFDNATVESSFDLVNLMGNVFDRQDEAKKVVWEQRVRMDDVAKVVAGREKPKALIVFPGMSMMSPNGMPAVFFGGIFDDVLKRAGVAGSFDGMGLEFTSTIDAEQLATADVDLLVVGGFMKGEDLDKDAAKLFADYPQWDAAKNKSYVTVSDGVYVGPTNAAAIEKIARAAHSDAF